MISCSFRLPNVRRLLRLRQGQTSFFFVSGPAGFESAPWAPQIGCMALRVSPHPDDDDGKPAGSPGVSGDRHGPLAALILFIALLFGAAPTVAGPGVGDPLSRVSSARQGRQAPARGAFEQDRGVVAAAEAEAGASVPPPPPTIVTAVVHSRPASDEARLVSADLPRRRSVAYSARAPRADVAAERAAH